MDDKLFDELIEGSIEMVGIEQLTRIASALERIAEALEKQNETKLDWPSFCPARWPIPDPKDWQWTGPTADAVSDKWLDTQKPYDTEIKYSTDASHPHQRFGIDYCMMGDDKTAETCRAKFDGMPNFGKCPDDRYLTKEEAHALNRAVKRSTIKVHDGKLEKD